MRCYTQNGDIIIIQVAKVAGTESQRPYRYDRFTEAQKSENVKLNLHCWSAHKVSEDEIPAISAFHMFAQKSELYIFYLFGQKLHSNVFDLNLRVGFKMSILYTQLLTNGSYSKFTKKLPLFLLSITVLL